MKKKILALTIFALLLAVIVAPLVVNSEGDDPLPLGQNITHIHMM